MHKMHKMHRLLNYTHTMKPFLVSYTTSGTSQVAQWVKRLPAIQEKLVALSLIPGSGRSPGGGLGDPLQYSCLKNPMDRGVLWATVHGVTKSQTRLKELRMPACI